MDRSAPRSLLRADLALALGASRDELAESARTSLEDDEAPATVEVWTTSRDDLLSVYEQRLAHTDAGEGPSTNQLCEYTKVLRDVNTPGLVGEAGWGVGNTFYVALLDGTQVLALTTVARAVAFLAERTTHLDGGTSPWVAVKTFGIGDGFNDLTLIKNTVSHAAYADNFQGLPVHQQEGGVHGQFRLDEIDPGAFTPVSATAARDILQTWADQLGNPTAAPQAALASKISPLLDEADSIYRFPSLGDGSAYESGWLVVRRGFQEFIAIDRGAKRLNVIVASDRLERSDSSPSPRQRARRRAGVGQRQVGPPQTR